MTFTPHTGLHPIFETLGYTVGYAVYRRARDRDGDFLPNDCRWLLIAAASIGALLGSRFLGLLEEIPISQLTWRNLLFPGGKTIVGGLLGGWIAVEIAKQLKHIHSRTGDLFVIPLCIGITIGRIGCFLAGLADDTFGTSTHLPWGIDFGDGIPRHPTQLYEILFLTLLAFALCRYDRHPHPKGATFRFFLAAYLTWRFAVDFIKPEAHHYGLNLIQWACLAGLFALAPSIIEVFSFQEPAFRSSP